MTAAVSSPHCSGDACSAANRAASGSMADRSSLSDCRWTSRSGPASRQRMMLGSNGFQCSGGEHGDADPPAHGDQAHRIEHPDRLANHGAGYTQFAGGLVGHDPAAGRQRTGNDVPTPALDDGVVQLLRLVGVSHPVSMPLVADSSHSTSAKWLNHSIYYASHLVFMRCIRHLRSSRIRQRRSGGARTRRRGSGPTCPETR